MCRTIFTVGSTTFIDEGVTEEQHHGTIQGEYYSLEKCTCLIIGIVYVNFVCVCLYYICSFVVGDCPINCGKGMLEKLFNEEQMLIIYWMAFEIDKSIAELEVNQNSDMGGSPTNFSEYSKCESDMQWK